MNYNQLGPYNPPKDTGNTGGDITIDAAFDANSENPVQNKLISEFRTQVLNSAEPPNYSSPSAMLNNVSGTYEVGEDVTVNLSAGFNKNDAGDATGYRLTKDGQIIANAQTFVDEITNGQAGTLTYRSQVDYADGPIKQNSFGIDDDRGQIEEGTVTSSPRNVIFRNKIFYASTAASVLAENARTLSDRYENQDDFNLTADERFITVFVPDGKTLTTAKNEDTNESLLAGFASTSVQVADAAGTLRNYTKYEYSSAVPLNGNVNLKFS